MREVVLQKAHARNRSAADSRVQLHFPRATSAQGSSTAADPHDGGRNPETSVAAVQQDVRESGSPVDSARAPVARTAVADIVFGAQPAAVDGRDGLQHFVSLVYMSTRCFRKETQRFSY